MVNYDPRWYQSESVAACWHYLCNEHGAPLIVLPTGAGKSICLAMLCGLARRHGGRVVLLAHRKELLKQNAEKIAALLPDENVGIYSAGLKSRNTDADIICAGIQSVHKRAEEFGQRHLVLIDEAHLVPEDGEGMYRSFLSSLRESNSQIKLAGLTATPYRTGTGPLCGKDKIFRRICYEAALEPLIHEGYLCSLTSSKTSQVDTSNIQIRGGEYVESSMIQAFGTEDNIAQACREIVTETSDRKSVLVFCSGVVHAEDVTEELRSLTGESVGIITGETFPMIRENLLHQFKSGTLRYLVNCDVLTTGFDAPNIDCIAVLRATLSPGLFAQMCGRGLRIAPNKTDCLILDFGGNIGRHGMLNDPEYGRVSASVNDRESKAVANNSRGKRCPNCEHESHSRAIFCEDCGFKFPQKHEAESGDEDIIGEVFETWEVISASYGIHKKRNAPEDHPVTLRADYELRPPETEGNLLIEKVSEWVCFDHDGFARQKADNWWQDRSVAELPKTVEHALKLIDAGAIIAPASMTTKREGKYRRVHSVKFIDDKPDSWAEIAAKEINQWFVEEVPF